MSLREYNRKRSFGKSPEPPGKVEKRKGALRFVIQLHRATRLHYDFRLEMGGVFKSWAVPRGPSLNPNEQRLAVFVEDHPIAYGSFEGIIPKGNYGAGTVMIWDEGTYEERGHLEGDSRAGEKAMLSGLDEGHITFVLSGTKLQGEFALIKLKKGEENAWLLVKKRDEFSTYKIPRVEEDRSAVSGRTLAEIASQSEAKGDVWLPKRTKSARPAAKRVASPPRPAPKAAHGTMPRLVRPMEPLISRALPEKGHWYFTPLEGGLRALAEVDGKSAHLYSKRGLRFDTKYPAVLEALENQGIQALLDGELSPGGQYRVFDLLYMDGKDLRPLPLKDRLARLRKLGLRADVIALAPVASDPSDLDGDAILARSADSHYRSGVDSDWLEVRGSARSATPAPVSRRATGAHSRLATLAAPGLVVSHPEKVFWRSEGITKGGLIEYYRTVAPALLPHLKDRPLSLHRFPNGAGAKGFYQKNFSGYKPRFLETFRLFSEGAGKSIDYVVCNNENTLLYLANLGCIEMNPWLSRTMHIGKPDFLVIDVDPDEHGFDEVVEVTHEIHKVLEKCGAESFCKTSGSTGMHVCVPLGPRYEYEEARSFAERVCQIVQKKLPELTTLERNPNKRGGRMYLDCMQNRIGQTLASAYSVRPRPGAPVSAPLKWSEVTRKLDPSQFHLHNMARRLDRVGDLWKPMLERQANVARCLKKLES